MADEQIVREYIIDELTKLTLDGIFFGDMMLKKEENETLRECLDKKTTEEILKKIKEFEIDRKNSKFAIRALHLFRIANEALLNNKITKEFAVIKENVQNTTDVVNLFTDIDKNRTSLEEQNKEITNRLDKLENKMDNLEANITQILKLLQKN